MTGTIAKIVVSKSFGFIKGENNTQYFFHREDFNGHWDNLIEDYNSTQGIRVEFEPYETVKGLRASQVTRLDFPNQVAGYGHGI